MSELLRPNRIPGSTYRLQLNKSFTFSDLVKVIDYLHCIGITDCYFSPILMAKSGSVHGYDVTNPGVLNPELGTEEEFQKVVQHALKNGMGIVVDLVPNHMCISDPTNLWWYDVLENGPSSPYSEFFDIDWNPPRENLANKVLLPVLDRQYGQALEGGQIKIRYCSGAFIIQFNGSGLPVNPRTWPIILQPALNSVRKLPGESSHEVMEFESILTALRYLPSRTETDEERVRERQREKEVIKRRLSDLDQSSQAVHEAIERAVEAINGTPGDPSSFDTLEEVLNAQAYRLSFWRVAAEEINYRRFFDVNDLAAIRVENPVVFQEVHRKVLEFVSKGWITGFRIDHADGLLDPVQYFVDLQKGCLEAWEKAGHGPSKPRSFYLIAEKILVGNEQLRPDWAIHGTTGYDFLNVLSGVFVVRGHRKVFQSFFARVAGGAHDFDHVFYSAKKLILSASMSSELNVLSRNLDRICQQQRHSRDFTLENLRFALGEIIASFPVYRTYTRMDQKEVKPEDRRHLISAVQRAKYRNPAASEDVFDFISSILLLQEPEHFSEDQKRDRRSFVMRFQQLTSPVMAKGLEDTAFYRSFPLASLNEVGGNTERFGLSVRHFHDKNKEQAVNWPYSLLASSTHDTKWGEDGRARLNVLSEIPLRWIRAVRRWMASNREHKVIMDGFSSPDRAEEYRLYQALIAAWPCEIASPDQHEELVTRIHQYMKKAAREAKLRTSWIQPNEPYEESLRSFVAKVLDRSPENSFLSDFSQFQKQVSYAGMLSSLSQTLLKTMSPGVPDFYQGCELWNFSLVDPDNRHPVDFSRGEAMLRELDASMEADAELRAKDLMDHPDDGRVKLYITSRALRFRRGNSELFSSGAYIPLRASGDRRAHVVAFARLYGSQLAVAVASRFFLKLGISDPHSDRVSVWADSQLVLPKGLSAKSYRDIFTGKILKPEIQQGRSVLPLAQIFSSYTVGLLTAL